MMELSAFSTVGLVEAEIIRHDALSELKQRGHGGIRRLRKGVYPRSQFSYANYKIDPRPDVLKLGIWVHPSTGNTLLGGINLNYLSARQVTKLKNIAKQLFRRGTLRSRYRYLKRKLPDIAQYYRTYDQDYVYADQPDEFKDYDYRDVREPELKDLAAQKRADVDRVADLSQQVEPDIEPDASVEKEREAWAVRRRLYDPDTGRRTRPEREKIRGAAKAKREKINRYRSQRRKLKQLEKDAELGRLAAAIKRDKEKTFDRYREPDIELPKQSELGPYESFDYSYSPSLGFVWNSQASYRQYHTPDNFQLIQEFCPGKPIAVHDVDSGQTLVDAVSDPAFILEQAGWDYGHTIFIERLDGELVVTSEIEQEVLFDALAALDHSRITTVLSE